MKAFPNPLTPAEEKKYIQRYTEGDLEAKHILIERNLRLVAHVIRKYQNTSEDPEDLISIGTIGLIKAIITFDPEKGNRLAAYASRCVENEVLMYLRARKKCSHEISLYEPIGTDREGNEVNLYDIIESTETDIPERIHLKDNIQKLYEKLENELSPREKLENAIRTVSGRRIHAAGDCRTTGHLPLLCIPYRKKCYRKTPTIFLKFLRLFYELTSLSSSCLLRRSY